MSPAFSRGSSGRLYRYYVSASLQQGRVIKADDTIRRVPAVAIERLMEELIARWLPKTGSPVDIPQSIHLGDRGLLVDMPGDLARDIFARLSNGETITHSSRKACRIEVPVALPLRGGKRLIIGGGRTSHLDQTLIAGLRKAHGLVRRDRGLPILTTAPASRYERDLLRLAFLAPDLQRDILAGHQPPTLTLEKLRHMDIPLCWREQRRALGWT
jgi:hypothetical protein